MEYKVKDGIYFLDSELSMIESKLFFMMEERLIKSDYVYLSIPSSLDKQTVSKQDINLPYPVLSYQTHDLAGSAEQGILEYFQNSEVKQKFIFAKNQCFRYENSYNDLIRVKEFVKLEQFCFSAHNYWQENFERLLYHATSFLKLLEVKHRVINVTNKDLGYHVRKYDIEIETKKFGWMETHSCSYFGQEQSKRFNIKGDNYTLSNTGIASPRILIPFIEDPQKKELLNG